MYQQYETQALRYLPEAKPRADIEGQGSHIADTHREDMVHIIYSIAYCNINDRQNKTQTPPFLSLAYFCALKCNFHWVYGRDPHIPRFVSYLSLFTFLMIILVTSDNYMQ